MSEPPKFKTFRDLRTLSTKVVEQSSSTSTPSSSSISSSTSTPSISEKKIKNENTVIQTVVKKDSVKKKIEEIKNKIEVSSISPEKDFQKVPNSIIRLALPDRLFRGKSKQVWDFLWSISRGSIQPSRKARTTRAAIKDKSGLGSMVTVDAAIEHLQNVGLIVVSKVSIGSSRGNEYEVFSPEEVLARYTSTSSISSNTSLTQKVDILDILESGISSISQTIETKDTYGDSKTYLKTNTNDDEKKALSDFEKVIESVSKELTGKGLKENERAAWKDLAELLVMELKVAALRTESISSVPAFLTEHLRRRLQYQTRQVSKPPKKDYKRDTVGKSDYDSKAIEGEGADLTQPDETIIETLTEKQRETVLTSMQEFIKQGKEDFVMSLENSYTKDDWQWLMNALKD